MARYVQGVNGSQRGAAGATDVFEQNSRPTLRRRRRDKLTARPISEKVAPPANVVGFSYRLTGFNLRNYYMRPLHPAWKRIWKPLNPKGRTWLSLAQKHAHERLEATATTDDEGVKHYSPSALPLADGSLGACPLALELLADRKIRVTRTLADLPDSLLSAAVLVCAVTAHESVDIDLRPLADASWVASLPHFTSRILRDAFIYVCAYTDKGGTETKSIYVPRSLPPAEPTA